MHGIENGDPIENHPALRDLRNANYVAAQIDCVRHVIDEGNPTARFDPNGADPPHDMPGWKTVLTAVECRSILAFLLMLEVADDEDDWDEEEADE